MSYTISCPHCGKPITMSETHPHPTITGVNLKLTRMSTDDIGDVVDYLNRKTGRVGRDKFQGRSVTTIEMLNNLVKQGFTTVDMKRVIDNMVTSWKGTKWVGALCPPVLFGPKFEQWLHWKPEEKDDSEDFSGVPK